jgi:uncharacterized protein (DUF433 family)
MEFPNIVRSAKIKGRGVRVASVAACASYGKSPDWIAENLGLTLDEVQTALTYYAHNVDEIKAEWAEDDQLEKEGKGFLTEMSLRLEQAKKDAGINIDTLDRLKRLEDKIAALRGGRG